jgi:hypothetical protein
VIASSGTALSNLAYLIGAIVLAVIGGFAVWLRHRKPKSVDANMASFKRGLNALAPDVRPGQAAGQWRRAETESHVQAVPMSLTHVRVERPEVVASGEADHGPDIDAGDLAASSGDLAAASEAAAKLAGGEPG